MEILVSGCDGGADGRRGEMADVDQRANGRLPCVHLGLNEAPGGVLRHKGWKADKVDLPKTEAGVVLAPAEIEIE